MLRIKRPFIISLTGIMLSSVMLMTDLHTLLWAGIILLSLLFIFSVIRRAAVSRVLLILISCALMTSTVFTLYDTVREKENSLTGYGKEISGTVTDISGDSQGDIISAVLSDCTVDGRKIYSAITVHPDKNGAFTYGDRLEFTAKELFTSEGGGIFRYHTLSDNCHLACTLSGDTATVTRGEDNIYTAILRFRGLASQKLRTALSESAFGISEALLTGSRDNVSPELSVAFRICGISHIFAVSGMHLSLWTSMFFLIMKRRARLSLIPNLLAIAFVIFYVIFTGFSPSVLRSAIMLVSVFTGRLIKRQADTLNSLGLAGTLLTAINPYLAGNVSFILSFTATAAIAFWSEYLLPRRKELHGAFRKIGYKILNPYYNTVTSLCVLLTTLPAVSLFFGYASLLSPLASLVVTPLAEAVMVLSSVLVLLPSDNILHTVSGNLTEMICSLLADTVTRLSEADFMLIPVKPSLILPVFGATALLCAVFLIFYKERKKAFICILSGALLFTGLTAALTYIGRDEAEISVFGTENATLISVSASSGNSAVIGAGGSYSLASQLTNKLNSKGIAKTDLLFIPREKDTENKNTAYLQKSLLPAMTVRAYEYNSPLGISLWENCRIRAFTDEDFSACALYIESTKIVICPLPSSVFGEEQNEFSSGDILICRSSIPESLDTTAFSDIIIVTDREKEAQPSVTYLTDKNLTITVKGDSYAIR